MTNQLGLDRVFHALAHEVRRTIVEQLGNGDRSVSQLAELFDIALPTLLKHLEVLEESGLVQSEKIGRVRNFRLRAKSMLEAEHWMELRRKEWTTRLDQLDEFLMELKKENE